MCSILKKEADAVAKAEMAYEDAIAATEEAASALKAVQDKFNAILKDPACNLAKTATPPFDPVKLVAFGVTKKACFGKSIKSIPKPVCKKEAKKELPMVEPEIKASAAGVVNP
mmetsp:Transcript_63752/g.176262  ORF Transcript_63752/g.176262 Transcript_63752/m.176262 type:complete len:113 (+) Transcript_63752:2-340(+)